MTGEVLSGVVTSVDVVAAGVDVREAALVGTTVVLGVDALDLDPGGGSLVLPSGAVVAFSGVDHAEDEVTLVEPLPEPLEEFDRLDLHPRRSHVQVMVAPPDGGDAFPARVPHTMQASLPAGVREGGGELVTVEVRDDDNGLWVKDVHDRPPLEVWGDPDGAHVQIAEDGIRALGVQEDPTRPGVMIPYVVSALTSTETAITVRDLLGVVLGGITSEGDVTGRSVSAGSMSVAGRPIIGTLAGESPGWMDDLPWGLIPGGSAATTFSDPYRLVNEETVYLRHAVNLRVDRKYKITATGQVTAESVGGVVRTRLRVSRDAVDPTSTSEELDQFTTGQAYTNTLRMTGSHSVLFTPSFSGEHRFALTYHGMNNSRAAGRAASIFIEDVGPWQPETGGSGGGSTKVRYRTTWKANGARTYNENGVHIVDSDGGVDQWYWRGSPARYRSPVLLFSGGAASSTSPSEVGKTISEATTGGAEVESVKIRLTNRSWFGAPSGTVWIGVVNSATLPSSHVVTPHPQITHYRLAAGTSMVRALPVSSITSGNRCFSIGDADGAYPGSTLLDSGAFSRPGEADAPEIEVVYTR